MCWSGGLNSKPLNYRYREFHNVEFANIISYHSSQEHYSYEHSGPLWTPFLCITFSILQTTQGIFHSVKTTVILPVIGYLLFFHSTAFTLSPASDYKCLEGRGHVFPNPSTVPNTKRNNMYTATSMLSTLLPWARGLFLTPMPLTSALTLEFFKCFSPFLYLGTKSHA